MASKLTLFTGDEEDKPSCQGEALFPTNKATPLAVYERSENALIEQDLDWHRFVNLSFDLQIIEGSRLSPRYSVALQDIAGYRRAVSPSDPRHKMLAWLKRNLILSKRDQICRASWMRIQPNAEKTEETLFDPSPVIKGSPYFKEADLLTGFSRHLNSTHTSGVVLLISDPFPGSTLFPEEMNRVRDLSEMFTKALNQAHPHSGIVPVTVLKLVTTAAGNSLIFHYNPNLPE